MRLPEVDLRPGDTIFKADEKVEKAFEAAGLTLIGLEELNSALEISSHCHFFQLPAGARSAVVVVVVRPWDEQTLIQVLNVLLGIRMDPDPPGSRPTFHFYSAYETPGILHSVFGSTPCCEFESRALLVARFGNGLRPELCQQLAALAAFLSRECLHVRVSYLDPAGDEGLERVIRDHFIGDAECVEPVNSLLALGCLAGEILRTRVPFAGRWEAAKECDPWPGLVFGAVRPIPLNPIASTIRFFQSPEPGFLARAAADIEERLRARGEERGGRRAAELPAPSRESSGTRPES